MPTPMMIPARPGSGDPGSVGKPGIVCRAVVGIAVRDNIRGEGTVDADRITYRDDRGGSRMLIDEQPLAKA
jgi:hypothetical protein